MKKKITAFLLTGMMLLAFAGCSGKDNGSSVKNVNANNPDDVLAFAETVENAVEGQKSGKADSAMNFTGMLSVGGDSSATIKLTYDGTISTEAQFDGKKTKTAIDGTMNLMSAVDVKASMEAYTTSGNGDGHDLYAKVSGVEVDDKWKKVKKDGSGVPVIMDVGFYENIKENHVEATLGTAQEKVGDTDCDVLNVKLTGQYVESAVGNMIEYIFGVQVNDWSPVVADAKIYVDASTNLPVQMTVDAQSSVSQIMELCKEQNAVAIDTETCAVTCTAGSWSEVSDITIAEEAAGTETSEDVIRLYRPELFN